MKKNIFLSLFLSIFVFCIMGLGVSASEYTFDEEQEISYMNHKMIDYMINGDWRDLLDFSTAVVRKYPEYPSGYFYRGIALDELDKHLEAVNSYDMVAKLSNNRYNEYLYQARGLANFKAGLYKAAMDDYNKSIKAKPTLRALYQRELARVAVATHRNQKTIKPDTPVRNTRVTKTKTKTKAKNQEKQVKQTKQKK